MTEMIVRGYRENIAVARTHALFDAFRSAADPYGNGAPAHRDIIRAVRNTAQSDKYMTAKRGLRSMMRRPDETHDPIEVIKRRKEKWDNYWSHPQRNSFTKAGQGIGVEMEFIVDIENQDELTAINGNHDGGVAGIRLVYDSTPHGRNDQEICREREARCFFQYGKWSRLYSVCQRLRDVGAEVNRTCGLHVHLDCRDCSSTSAMQTRATRLKKALPWLWDMVPSSRQSSSYCSAGSGRYQAINTESWCRHQTVEVRMHSGTLNPDKIRNWIELVRFIALRSGVGKRPTHLKTLAQFLSCNQAPDHLKQWAIARTNTFNPVDGTEGEASEENSE